jgi:AraC family ethanolamine operon transcriptional activator
MARSITSVLHQTDDFQDALSGLGDTRVVVTGQGRLQVRITHLALKNLRLLTVRENLPRIAFIRTPDNTVLLSIPLGGQTVPVWAGIKIPADELIVVCGGESLHTRTDGASHWCAILLPLPEFMRFHRAVTGETSKLLGAVSVWRPPPSARNTLLQLVTAAARAAQTQSVAVTMDQAVHGLEQQLIHCTLDCLVGPPVIVEKATAHRQRELASRFESLLQSQREGNLPALYLAGTLGISDRALRRCCELHCGMSPKSYFRLYRMQWAYRALQNGASQALRVSDLAERYGFRHPSRFARAYHELFGELPSWTLRGGGDVTGGRT